jgi:hypothetical protein
MIEDAVSIHWTPAASLRIPEDARSMLEDAKRFHMQPISMLLASEGMPLAYAGYPHT